MRRFEKEAFLRKGSWLGFLLFLVLAGAGATVVYHWTISPAQPLRASVVATERMTSDPSLSPTEASREETVVFLIDRDSGTYPQPLVPWVVDDSPNGSVINQVRAALKHLVRGPTEEQEAEGLGSMFVRGMGDLLNEVTLKDGYLIIDLKDAERISGANTSDGSGLFHGQIVRTAFQFPEVETIELRLDGSCQSYWDWMQSGPVCRVRDRSDWRSS